MSELKITRFEKTQRHCRNGARGLLLFSLVYVTWRYGGVDAPTLVHVSLLMIGACLLAFIGQPKFGIQAKPLPKLLIWIITLALLWPVIQSIQLPTSIYNAVATGQHEVDRSLADATFETTFPLLRPTVDATIESVGQSRFPRRSISVVAALTEVRVNQWVLMTAYVFLSALLLDSRRSRKWFLWTLAINTGLIASWGLIQRVTGSTDLLPGITRSMVQMPFGPFIYKNAGAAALLPGLAASIALAWPQWLPRYGTKHSTKRSKQQADKRKADFEYRSTSTSDATRYRLLMGLIGLSIAGLLMSYSRGAWIGAIVATIATLIFVRQYVSKRTAILLVGVPILICLTIVMMPRGINPVVDRIDGVLSTNYVYADARWEQWKEGFRAAKKYFPVGSGVGTYGYATLAEQQSDSRLWFREAHNHYLETLVEQGLPGLLLLIIGGLCLLRYSYKLLTNQVSRERSAIGVAGMSALIAIAIQSTVDFVILIPAVMFLFASLFGVVAQAYATPAQNSRIRTVDPKNLSTRGPAGWKISPIICLLPVLFCLLGTHARHRDRATIDHVMAETRPNSEAVPDDLIIDANLDRLNDSIALFPNRADLLERRGYWNCMKLRVGLRRSSMRAGNEMSWHETSLVNLFQTLMTLPELDRNLITDEIAIDSSLREPLRQSIADLQAAVDRNPYVPQCHRTLALLAPATGVAPAGFNERLCRLAHSNPRTQFIAGLIAHFTGDRHRMLDQWRRSLRGTCPEFPQMVRLCGNAMSPREIVTVLIPDDRTELLLPMVRAFDQEQRDRLGSDTSFFHLMERRIFSDAKLDQARRHALLAWIATDLNRESAAIKHWRLAVATDKSNGDYRYQFCRSLMRDGELEEVFRQCSLGQALEPKGDRFRKMAETARSSITSHEL